MRCANVSRLSWGISAEWKKAWKYEFCVCVCIKNGEQMCVYMSAYQLQWRKRKKNGSKKKKILIKWNWIFSPGMGLVCHLWQLPCRPVWPPYPYPWHRTIRVRLSSVSSPSSVSFLWLVSVLVVRHCNMSSLQRSIRINKIFHAYVELFINERAIRSQPPHLHCWSNFRHIRASTRWELL